MTSSSLVLDQTCTVLGISLYCLETCFPSHVEHLQRIPRAGWRFKICPWIVCPKAEPTG